MRDKEPSQAHRALPHHRRCSPSVASPYEVRERPRRGGVSAKPASRGAAARGRVRLKQIAPALHRSITTGLRFLFPLPETLQNHGALRERGTGTGLAIVKLSEILRLRSRRSEGSGAILRVAQSFADGRCSGPPSPTFPRNKAGARTEAPPRNETRGRRQTMVARRSFSERCGCPLATAASMRRPRKAMRSLKKTPPSPGQRARAQAPARVGVQLRASDSSTSCATRSGVASRINAPRRGPRSWPSITR